MGFGYGQGTVITHDMPREKGVRKVFSTDMVAHVWAQQNQSEGRSGKGTIWFRGEWLYSYRTAIARILAAPSGEKIMLIRDERFSVTTNQHMPRGRIFDGRSFRVPFIGSSEGMTAETYAQSRDFHNANVRVFWDRWQAHIAGERKRTAHSWESERLAEVSGERYWQESAHGPRPTDLESAVAAYQSRVVAILMDYRTQAEEYATAFGVAMPAELLDPAMSAYHARVAATEIVAKFRKTLDNPANKRKREASAAKRAAKCEDSIAQMIAARAHWLTIDESILLSDATEYHRSNTRAPTFGYRVDGLTRAQASFAATRLRELESKSGFDRAITEKEGRLETALNAALREKEAADFAAWRAGENRYCPSSYYKTDTGGAYLRVRGDLLETSQGASVPLADAVRVFKVAKAIREKYAGTTTGDDLNQIVWTRNGSTLKVAQFQVDSFRADGSFKAGCHVIHWPEIETAAVAAGVIDDAGSLDAIQHKTA